MADVTLLRTGHQQPSWSDIPLDLAGMVLRLLPAYADRARFASVCPQWRAAARQLPLPPPLPLLALPYGTFFSLPYSKTFHFPGRRCAGYKTAACGKWLVFPRDNGRFLFDPFVGSIVMLPALSRVRLRPPNAVAKYVHDEVRNMTIAEPFSWMHLKEGEKVLTISKLIVCSPNLVAAFVGKNPVSQILVCQPGASSWSVRANDKVNMFQDMAFYQGKLYALAVDENLLVVNFGQDPSTGDPQVSRIGHVIKGDPWYTVVFPDNTMGKKKLYLVESCGMLLMVRRKVWCIVKEDRVMAMTGENDFEVFKADFEHSRWYGMPGDRIFFLDDQLEDFKEYAYDEDRTSVGVYNMKTREVSFPLPMVWNHEMISVTWLFP
ncbi:hypothetical protein PR202_ga25240 [Eleusine coracana subsp. coracana]|uniref:DUF295 domain-containing protein n=1 Tax=Eleusine coracana subsp. coracana TaxID=191504 RepID=A0AAV5DAH6_ELECO|nr:hypothetical protein PR202_ga25240 [Eleusine coracana subsp. coracana]